MTGQTHPHPDPPLEGEGIKRGTNTTFPIVGIGASAGGLDALQRFLSILPQDFGFALVFIQHLSSKHKSLLPELLAARRPSLVIQEISDGLKAQPGRLYLSPPGKEVRLHNGLFQTTVHPEGLIHLPIDEFLASLAEDADGRSIAVIFSGAGTDGARGCQAVRSAGGTVFVQDPETTEFSSMPLAAIATGQADAVLSPEDICRELLKLQGIGAAAVGREYPIAPEEFDTFFRLLRDKTGSRFNHYKKSVVSRRIKRRMYLHGLSSVKDYLDLISARDAEAALLASDLMIGVTSFFRDRVAWKALNLEAVRKIAAGNIDLPVRVWTPATATGEEAYSIAMMLMRELDLAGKKRDVQVFATDVNDRALERAREGRYSASISADAPKEYIQKFFTSGDDGNVLVINKEVRESVVFAKQDLLTDPPFSKLDLIICRNFMIYLEPEAQEKCIRLFHYALKEGGFLFLGNAETVGRNSRLFQSMGRKQCRIYRKLETMPASRLPLSVPYATERQAAPPARQTQITGQGQSTTEIVQEKLLEEYGPASVAIDQHHEIIYHNGPTNKYLRQPRGVPTQNLLELLPDSLRSRIRGALYRSGREERPVVIRTSVAGDDNKKRHITLRITKAADNLYIVVFHEKGAPSKEEAAEQVEAAVIEETAIHQLESELAATRADLQSHIEQLKSLNEELQSSNEELQAANEELETSREELQSLNEELITVNSQLQGKIEEQDVTNNDLNNFLASTNIPTIFLDTHFRVKRFTPAMLKLIKLLPSDVGRPIVDMSQENLGPDLTSDAQSVLESLVPARQEMQINGEWYVRTTLPYRTADNRIEGVVVTYNDVSDLKKSEERTRHLASFPELNPNPVCEVQSSGKVNFCNPATVKVLANLGMDTEDLTVFMPEDMDNILRDLEDKEETSLYREKAIRDHVFGLTVHLAPQFNVVRIYAYDITERKRAEEALRKSEEQFRTLADSIPNLTWWANADGYITWYNRRWYEYTGTTPEQMEGWGWQSVHDPEVLPKVLERWKASIATGEPFDMEFPLRGSDGIFRSFLTRVMPLKDSAGRVQRWFGTNTDISALKQAEEQLRRAADFDEAALKSLGEGLYTVDDKGLVTSMNPVAEKLFGWTFAELRGKKMHDVTHHHYRDGRSFPSPECAGFRVLTSGAPLTNHEDVFIRKDGTFFDVTYSIAPLRDNIGKINGLVVVFSDITERKQAEEALRESEEKFRGLFTWMGEAIQLCELVLDEGGRPIDVILIDVNPAYEKETGLSREKVVGRRIKEVLPAVEQVWLDRYGELVRTGKPMHFEEYNASIGRWFEVYASPMKGNRFAVVFTDVTERKKAEVVQGRLSAIVSNSEDAIISKDLNGVIQTWNVGAEKIFGYTAQEVIGKNISFLIPPDHADEVPDILKRLSHGEHIENFETVRMRKDGTIIPVSLNFSPIKDASGRIIGASKIAHDITERKRAEEALRESEVRVRRKLESVLSPEGDIGNLELGDIIDPLAIQSLVDNLYKFVHLPIGILDLKGKVLVAVGWQDICTKFHRAHPDACRHCTESDLELTRGVVPGEFKLYKCKNGMWDAVTPVIVGGQHMGNLFWGQFFFDDEPVDREFFRAQARKYGFDEEEYLAALEKVPRISRAALDQGMAFYQKLADMLSKLSYGNIKLAQTLSVRDTLLHSLRESEEQLKRAQEISHLGSWDLDLVNNRLAWSDEVYRIFGLQPQEFGATYEAFLEAVHPDDRTAVDAAYSGSIRDGKDTYEIEHRVMRKSAGEIRYVLEKCQHFRDETGKIIRSVGMVHDITAHKQAEEALKESENRYHNLFNTMEEGFCIIEMIFDAEGRPADYRFLEVNAAFEKQTGLHDATGKLMRELAPALEAHWFEIYGKIALTGEPLRFVNEAKALDRYYDVSAYRIGRPEDRHVAVIFNDISMLKRTEKALLRLNKALKALSDSSQAVISSTDEPQYLNSICRIIAEDCGYSMVWIGFAENDEEKSVRPIAYSGFEEGYLETLHITWADAERGRGPTGTAIRTGKIAVCRNMLIDPAFAPWREEAIKRGYASSIVFPLRADGRVFGAISLYSKEADPFTEDEVRLLTELTDNVAYGIEVLRIRATQKMAEEALRRSEEKYRTLFENMIDGLAYHRIVTDENGKPVDYIFLEVNEAFEKQTGLKRAAVIGKSAREALPGIENDPADWIGTYGNVALTGQEARFQHYAAPLGKWYSVSAYSPLKGYFVAIFEDVTDRKQAEQDLLKLSEDMAARNIELESANKEMESFIYSISHDLRAPIRTMSGFSRIIIEDYADKFDEQGKDYLARIQGGSERATQLIDDLLRLARISRQDMELIEVDLSKKAASVMADLRVSGPGRTVDVVIAPGLKASADPILAEIILSNLLGNAWKFTSKTENARIEFNSVEIEGKTVYYVKDNGAGFDPAYADKMFWPFHRLHSENEFEGTGIGLTIVERVVRRHGGRIWAEGEVGKGATVYFTLG